MHISLFNVFSFVFSKGKLMKTVPETYLKQCLKNSLLFL